MQGTRTAQAPPPEYGTSALVYIMAMRGTRMAQAPTPSIPTATVPTILCMPDQGFIWRRIVEKSSQLLPPIEDAIYVSEDDRVCQWLRRCTTLCVEHVQ